MGWFLRTSGCVHHEAARWVARRNGRPLTQADKQAFARWYRADPRNAETYDRLDGLWELSARATPIARSTEPRTAGQRPASGWRLGLAASLFALAVLGVTVLLAARPRPEASEPLYLASALGEIVPVTLADGSQVILDTQSKVRVDYTRQTRHLTLVAGRARFVVAREARPFAVSAAGRQLVATGTMFDVSLVGLDPAVHLLEGSLEIRGVGWSPGMPVAHLQAGDVVTIGTARPRTASTRSNTGDAWTRRMLEFEATPLAEAVRLANRYSRLQIRLDQPRLRDRTITGAYHVGDASAFARSVAVALGLAVRRDADGSIVLADR